jgi:mono/diheme cytochrome c family protein
MPAFGSQLTPEQIEAVITYIKSLWTPNQRQAQAEISRRDPLPPR